MIDIYEASDEVAHVAGNDEAAIVFAFVGQEPLPEGEDHGIHLHMPHTRGYS